MAAMPRDVPSLEGEWKRILAELAELADGATEWDQLDAAIAEIRSLGAARLKARRPFQPSLPTFRSPEARLEAPTPAPRAVARGGHSEVPRIGRRRTDLK